MNQPPKVLIVEDEAIIALDIQDQISNAGFTVSGTARSAAQAFHRIEQETPDIILMDIRIDGDIDGVQAASIIRSRYGLPVIYLTAYADDETLERAKATAPVGYIQKPLGNTNVKAMITMALHKHQNEREVQKSRRLLTAVLEALPDAVLVADPAEILFLNRAAASMTGWTVQDALRGKLAHVLVIRDNTGRDVLPDLMNEAFAKAEPVEIPRDCVLVTRSGSKIEIAGQLKGCDLLGRPRGLLLTLRDVTVERRTDERILQEQRMGMAAELAQGVGRELYSLFDLINAAAGDLTKNYQEPDAVLIQKASESGVGMSTHLLELAEGNGPAHVINVRQFLLSSQHLLQQICRKTVRLEISSLPELGYVLSTGNHLEQMLIHLVLEGKQRISGDGVLSLGADLHVRQQSSMIRFVLRAERSQSSAPLSDEPFLFGPDAPDLGMAMVHAIASGFGGFTRATDSEDGVSIFEVFLPLHASRMDAFGASHEYSQAVLLVGLEGNPSWASVMKNLSDDTLSLNVPSLADAALVSELYQGDIDLVVLNAEQASSDEKNRALKRIRGRRPDIVLFEIGPLGGHSAMKPSDLRAQIKQILERKKQQTHRRDSLIQ